MLIMKLNKLFHWLYFCVMALPLVVAPIFAIYSHRHTLTEQTSVEIQYKYQTNVLDNTFSNMVNGNIYKFEVNDEFWNVFDYDYGFYCDFVAFEYDSNFLTFEDENGLLLLYIDDNGNLCVSYDDGYPQIMSLMYEPIYISSFNWDSLLYYENHIEISSSDYLPIDSVTVNDSSSDIMSVFVNNYAEAINKYFNYDNAFNFGGLYTWLNTNFFSGNAPLGFFIFWHLLIYWLLTSLLWLIFDVLMYVPMLVHRWLDKASLS